MKKFGSIVSENGVPGFEGSRWALEPVPGLPTLYVGLSNASSHIPGFSILKKRYDGDVWWTFSKRERRSEHNDDIRRFREHCIRKALGTVRYVYVDFTAYGRRRLIDLLKYMLSEERKVCYYTGLERFLFVYGADTGVVFGISLSLLWYVGVEPRRVISLLKGCPSNEFVHGTSFISKDDRPLIGDDTHLVPVFYDIVKKT